MAFYFVKVGVNVKKSSFNELLLFVLVFGLGIYTFPRGAFFTLEQEAVLNDSEFYVALHHIMPIWVWGVFAVVCSIFIMISAWFIPKQKINNTCNWLLLIGGVGNAILHFLMTSASIFHAINWLSTVQFAVLTVVFGVIAFIGGADIYDRRN